MGLYSRFVFPVLMNWTLGNSRIGAYRKALLTEIHGRVLEIGLGTGLNLPHYPETVEVFHAMDPHPGMKRWARKRLAKFPIRVMFHQESAEKLPFENESLDAVVSTFTLCSIPEVDSALQEVHRVLKPRGRIYFLEHGLAPEPKVQKRQRRYTPLQKMIAGGCHLDRDITGLIDHAGFKLVDLKKFYYPGFPKVAGFFYQGVAEKIGNG
jgi:ubiquinone/menaquinone biosynthesis C-methylase UbiE